MKKALLVGSFLLGCLAFGYFGSQKLGVPVTIAASGFLVGIAAKQVYSNRGKNVPNLSNP